MMIYIKSVIDDNYSSFLIFYRYSFVFQLMKLVAILRLDDILSTKISECLYIYIFYMMTIPLPIYEAYQEFSDIHLYTMMIRNLSDYEDNFVILALKIHIFHTCITIIHKHRGSIDHYNTIFLLSCNRFITNLSV